MGLEVVSSWDSGSGMDASRFTGVLVWSRSCPAVVASIVSASGGGGGCCVTSRLVFLSILGGRRIMISVFPPFRFVYSLFSYDRSIQ